MPQQVILFLAANPSGTTRLALDAECAAIERELRMGVERDFEFQSRWAVTVDELMRHLNALQPTVLHFSGHGYEGGGRDGSQAASPASRDVDAATRGGGQRGIYLEDDRRGPQLVTADALTRMIRSAAASVRLVVLNACYSDAQADVVRGVVDCVVGMEGAIDDDAARAFAVSFYRALAYRRSVANAVEQAAAALAGGQLPGEHVRCRTRAGVDATSVILSGPAVCNPTSGQRFDAVIRRAREAHEKLSSDPFGAAARAQQAVEHIVSYLHEREIGMDHQAAVDAKLRRIEAKLVIPPMVANHFASVLMHTGSVIHSGAAVDPEPDLLRPCLGSLAVVIEWFFREYVKQPAPEFAWGSLDRRRSDRLPAPDITPINSTDRTLLSTGTRFATGIGELVSIWRPRPIASVLRIEAKDDDGSDERVFKIEDPETTYFIGRTEQRRDGTRNDFALPTAWNAISRDQGTLVIRDGDVIFTNTSDKDNVFVRGELVARGCARCLRHGDSVQIGRCVGTFADGRYYATTPPAAIDRRTGLLARRGLIAEIGEALASDASRLLFVIRCPADVMNPSRGVAGVDPERKAVIVASALHRHDPSSPIARIGLDVAMVLANHEAVTALAAVAHRAAGARCVSGFLKLHGPADQALPRLEACLGALSRIAIAGREPVGPEDLSRYALVPTPLDAFAGPARRLFEIGGGAVLFVLGDLERLQRMVPQALPVLELELVEMLGARMGPRDLVSFAAPGLLLFGTPGDAERFACEVAVAWHARGPVTANGVEIDRCLSAHLLAISDLDELTVRAAALVRGETAALRASGLPAPLALGAIVVDEARDPIERARALVRLAELGWKLLAFILVAAARGVDRPDAPDDTGSEARSWPAPWRSLVRTTARRLEGQPPRMMELGSVAFAADREGVFRDAMDAIAAAAEIVMAPGPDLETIEMSLPRLEKAVREMFTALAPLRGWTLVAIVTSEIVDMDGATQRIEYIDYTGSSRSGSSQRVTVMGFRGLGRFAYLVRWDEGLAIALEPFVRRAQDGELFLANALVSEPGEHRYRSIVGTREIEQLVTVKQLGIPTGRR